MKIVDWMRRGLGLAAFAVVAAMSTGAHATAVIDCCFVPGLNELEDTDADRILRNGDPVTSGTLQQGALAAGLEAEFYGFRDHAAQLTDLDIYGQYPPATGVLLAYVNDSLGYGHFMHFAVPRLELNTKKACGKPRRLFLLKMASELLLGSFCRLSSFSRSLGSHRSLDRLRCLNSRSRSRSFFFFLAAGSKNSSKSKYQSQGDQLFHTSPHFLNLPFKRYAHGFKNRYPSILGKFHLSSFF
jgi:hypothetical protein